MNDRRLLFLTSTLEVGGSETKIVRVANALSRTGSPTAIAYLNPPATLRDRIDREILVADLHRRGKYSFCALRRLLALLRGQENVLFAVNLYPLLYAIPAAKARVGRKSRVIGLVNTAAETRSLRLLGWIYAPFLRRCDRIVFGCESELTEWTRRFRLPRDKSLFIYNGIDSDHFSPEWCTDAGSSYRRQQEIPAGAIVFGSIGRLAPEKNFDLLLSAIARLNSDAKDCYLILVGQGREKARLEMLANDLGIAGKVRFIGLLDDVRVAISMMDAFVLPSREVETFSNAALEAMAMGKPVILSEMGGAAEMVENETSGLLFKVGDFEGLCDALTRMHTSKAMRVRIGQAARARVQLMFTFTRMLERYRDLAAE